MNRISRQLIKIANETTFTKILKIQKSKNTTLANYYPKSDIICGYKFNLKTLLETNVTSETDFTDVRNYNVELKSLTDELTGLCYKLKKIQYKINDIIDQIFEKYSNKEILQQNDDGYIEGKMEASIFKYNDIYCIVGMVAGITDDILKDVIRDIETML